MPTLCHDYPRDWGSAWLAPAKLNLFLHIVGRRADGYHLLQSVFRLLDTGDVLRFYPRNDAQIILRRPIAGVLPESDLCTRAAKLLQRHATQYGLPIYGADIDLDKRLPMGGGLGGGSSDAATVLKALNQLWGYGLSTEILQVLGLELGADVPVFVYGQNAFAEGVGEKLTPVDLAPAWYLVLEPPAHVPTAIVFSDPSLCRNTPILIPKNWSLGIGHNDLEPVACHHFPVIRQYLDWLNQFAFARMSGSGACVFAEFSTQQAAEAVLDQCPDGMRAWVAAGF
jgi:4-diphosphocytidyl-2-C-methyl-D-erythritol kinase